MGLTFLGTIARLLELYFSEKKVMMMVSFIYVGTVIGLRLGWNLDFPYLSAFNYVTLPHGMAIGRLFPTLGIIIGFLIISTYCVKKGWKVKRYS